MFNLLSPYIYILSQWISVNLPYLLALSINLLTSIGHFQWMGGSWALTWSKRERCFASSVVMRSCRCKHPAPGPSWSKGLGERPGEMAALQSTSWTHTQVTGVISPGHLAQAFHQPRLAHPDILLIRKVYFRHSGNSGVAGDTEIDVFTSLSYLWLCSNHIFKSWNKSLDNQVHAYFGL